MLQSDQLFEWRTIIQNAALGLEIQKKMDHAAEDRLHRLLKLYGLEQFEHSRPSELSGGMRQRAALIRTLALEPELLLLDEPFSALDYQTRLTVCDDISTIIRESRKTAILITHDLSEAVSAADRILVLTKRPGTICRILPVTFPPSANRPLERRNDPAFSLYFNEIWKTLQGEGAEKKHEMEERIPRPESLPPPPASPAPSGSLLPDFLIRFLFNMLGNERPAGTHRRVYFQFPVAHGALFPADDAGQKHPRPHRRDAL